MVLKKTQKKFCVMPTYVGLRVWLPVKILVGWNTIYRIFRPSQEPESQVPSNIDLDDDAVHNFSRRPAGQV